MRRITILGLSATCSLASAMQISESPYLASLNESLVQVGGAALTHSNEESYLSLQVIRGNLPIGGKTTIPFSISSTIPSDGKHSNSNEISHLVLSHDTGLVNAQINLLTLNMRKKTEFNQDNFQGICAFEQAIEGMCLFRLDGGIKHLSYNETNDENANATSAFLSAGIQLDIPFSKGNSPYRRLTLSSFYTAQKFDSTSIFSHINNTEKSSPDRIDTVDVALDYRFTKSFSLQVSGTVWSDFEEIDRNAQASLIYRHNSF